MIPFFVKVRSEDIVKTDPIKIDAVLTPTSMRWTEARVEDNVDVTVYKYTANWVGNDDPHHETVDPTIFEGELLYKMYKDGRMEVTGSLRMEPTGTDITANFIKYSIHLPFAFPEEKPQVSAKWKYADFPGLITTTNTDSIPISNAELNMDYTDSYPYHLNVWLAWPNSNSESDAALFKLAAELSDPRFTEDMTIDNYLNHFTFNINYSGWWRAEKLPTIVPAESYNSDFAGLYTTTGMVAMLSAPSTTLGVTVRALAIDTTVRNHGYYTTVDGINWLLCTYQSTNETGYIREDLLIAQ